MICAVSLTGTGKVERMYSLQIDNYFRVYISMESVFIKTLYRICKFK